MIAKGNTHNNGAKLGRYMTEAGEDNEYAELYRMWGFAEDNIVDAFRTVQGIAAGTRCEQPFFHCQVRTPAGESLTREQWERVADRIEKKLGLTDQPRAIAFHLKDGHEHMHVAWSRIDEETLKAKPLPFFKLRLKEVCRELEIELGLTQVRNEREPGELKAPTREEYEQASRLGVHPKAIRTDIREAWERSDNGQAFVAALADRGLVLARGERRDYVVIDQEGGLHALGKRILGSSAAQTRERMADLDRDQLPTVDQARGQQQARKADYHATAVVSEKERTDAPAQKAALAGLREADRADNAALYKHDEAQYWKDFRQNQDAATAMRTEQWEKKAAADRSRIEPSPVKAGLTVVDGMAGAIGKLADFLCDLLTGGSGPRPHDPNQHPVERIIEQRRAADALKRIGQSLTRGESLASSDLRSLTRDQLENIQAKGDDGLRHMIEQLERDRQRDRDRGRSRER